MTLLPFPLCHHYSSLPKSKSKLPKSSEGPRVGQILSASLLINLSHNQSSKISKNLSHLSTSRQQNIFTLFSSLPSPSKAVAKVQRIRHHRSSEHSVLHSGVTPLQKAQIVSSRNLPIWSSKSFADRISKHTESRCSPDYPLSRQVAIMLQ